MNFETLGLIGPLLKTLERENIQIPTLIQQQVIPAILEKKDVLGLSQTGSGKTLAFGLPVLQNLYKKEPQERFVKSLILAPTRELALQIGESLSQYCVATNLKQTIIFGGVNQFHQEKALQKGVDVVVGTPGRILDLLQQKILKLSECNIFVLDEADKMLDMGFFPDIVKIQKFLPERRQNLFFSATFPESLQKYIITFSHQYETIRSSQSMVAKHKIEKEVYFVSENNKQKLVQYLLKNENYDTAIIFVNTKDDADRVLEYVQKAGKKADIIHRNRSQNARQRAITAIKNNTIDVLVATDIASRGIDIDGLDLVINFSLPKEAETFIHRMGRTARAGKTGKCISFCIEEEKIRLEKIQALLKEILPVQSQQKYLQEVIEQREYLGSFGGEKNFGAKKKRYSSKRKK